MNTLGKLRKSAGFKSANQFAKHMDIPQATYNRYENKPEKIPTAALVRLANELHCSVDDILERSENTHNNSDSRSIQFRCTKCHESVNHDDLTLVELRLTKGSYTGTNLDDQFQNIGYLLTLCDSCCDQIIKAVNDALKDEKADQC